jgi:2,3-bisphosphoglycerate-independent phosphoglycerate mutase
VILGILDGWGIGPIWGGNAITQANTPNFYRLWNKFPHTSLRASGKAVGLPGHEMGNSEVGHLTIGAGRVISQDVSRINQEIENRNFFHNKVLLDTIRYCKTKRQPLHLMGLLTKAPVHASLSHLLALLDLCQMNNFRQVYLHLITDGRDSPSRSALELLEKVRDKIDSSAGIGIGKIASISGRYYSMDRDNHWGRTREAFDMLTQGRGKQAVSARQAISQAYRQGQSDEFIPPTNIAKNHLPLALIEPRSAVIFFNFRQDRARQLSKMMVKKIPYLRFISFVPYQMLDLPKQIQSCFEMPEIKNHLAQVLSDHKLSQVHISETEKFSHLTYFFNGGNRQELAGEKRILIDSFPAATFDQYPQMRSAEITEAIIRSIRQKFDFILFNFANADMVAHTGNMEAVISGVEAIDKQLGRIFSASHQRADYNFLVTADHGNAEEMVARATGEPHTEHTTSLVPFIFVHTASLGQQMSGKKLRFPAGLSDIAPTILDIMRIRQPKEMTGRSLI